MQNRIRKTSIDAIEENLIDVGKNITNLSSLSAAAKSALEKAEKYNEDRFINLVLNGNKIDLQSLDAVRNIKRLYKSIQVVSKAITQEKIDRFVKLTANGIMAQDQISDEDYELFVNIVDELTDQEFLILHTINEFELPHVDKPINEPLSRQLSEELLSRLNMDEALFKSYVARLKAKGLIIDEHGSIISYKTKFFIDIVDGNISVLYKKLIEFLEKEY